MDPRDKKTEITITEELASISLNPNGKISIEIDKQDFVESITRTFGDFHAELIGCPKKWVAVKIRPDLLCLHFRVIPQPTDILRIVDQGILAKDDFSPAQLDVINLIRNSTVK